MTRPTRHPALVPIATVLAGATLLGACASGSTQATSATGKGSPPSTAAQPTTTAPATTVPAARAFVAGLGKVVEIGSTVPPNGDVNPYGIVVVPRTVGRLRAGDVLVSNYNDKANVQGTGTTLVELSPRGRLTLFSSVTSLPPGVSCPGGIGLGTGLAVLPGGWVVVGSIPAAGPSGAPTSANPAGCLVVLDSSGKVVETWSGPDINGPWDLTASVSGPKAALFVSNVLSRPAGVGNVPPTGQCTIVRVDVRLGSGPPRMTGTTVIGSGFAWQVNKPTFVLGPTGLGLAPNGTLYVAQTLGNHVTAIPDALTRTSPVADGTSTLSTGGALNAPLGLVVAPDGDLVVTNGNDGNVVEITPAGIQIAKRTLVSDGAGDLFGVALSADGRGLMFVNDGANAVDTAPGM